MGPFGPPIREQPQKGLSWIGLREEWGLQKLTRKRECDIPYENEKLAKVGNSFKKGGMPNVFTVLITKPFYFLGYKAILLGKLELMKISLSFPDYYLFSCEFYNSLRSVEAVFFN